MKTSGYLRLLAAGWLSTMILLASEQHGQVTFGGLPVPGVAVTATQGEKIVKAITDGMGTYSFPDLADGTWSVQLEMSGFTTLKQDVTVAPGGAASTFELKLKGLSEMQATVQAPVLAEPRPAQTAAVGSAPAKPSAPAPAKPKPTVQASAAGGRGAAGTPAAGAAAAPADTPAAAPSEANQQSADGFLVNGSQVNGGASPFALNPAFGNNRRGPRSLYTYLLSVNNINTSLLNARPFSQTGQVNEKPTTSAYQAQGSIQGPLRIPHLLRNGPTFFINYALTRGRNANTQDYGLVPTEAQRGGNLSSFANPIIDPTTLLPFSGNIIPATRISQQATALLSLYPAPNFNSTQYNYQIPLVNVQHQDSMNTRVNKQIGRKNSILATFAFQDTRNSNPTLFGFLDTNTVFGFRIDPQWRHQWTPRLSTTLEYDFSRQATHQYSFFGSRSNVSGLAGIEGNLQSPAYWGPPNLNFTSGIQGLTDANPSFIRPQTGLVKSDSTWNHGRHTVTFGVDFRRQEFNYFQQSNPRGNFTFTGQATESGPTSPGSDFADFLLGIPDSSSLAYGNADKYLRASSYDAYVQDDWRVNSALTVNGGIRWEYSAPITELYGRLVNLDVAPGFTAVAPVLGNSPVGPLTGQNYSSSLMHPDKHGFEPGVGLAWRPISGSSLVVRSGYQLRYSTSVYNTIANQMDQQYPLSRSFTVNNTAANPLTLANGFNASPAITQTTFAIDPNFKIGYAQNWYLMIQKDLPWGMQMQARYDGLKGTRLPEEFFPNSYAPNGVNPCPACPVGFLYETSNGNSTRNSGYIQLRRRLHNGFLAQGQYTYAKAIDDTLSGGANNAAQNWLNLSGERGLSTFDQRQAVTVTLQYTSGMGIGGGTFISGWKAAVLKEWTFVVPVKWGTGLPENLNFNDNLGGTGYSGPLRPEFTGAPLYAAPAGLFLNPEAITAPPAGEFGNAARNAVTGPYQFSLNASLQRTFRISDRVTLNLRVDSNNTLNHVVFGNYGVTYLNSQFGVASNANQMRSMLTTFQFRF